MTQRVYVTGRDNRGPHPATPPPVVVSSAEANGEDGQPLYLAAFQTVNAAWDYTLAAGLTVVRRAA